MPLSPVSERKSTTAYAIDLLRAHQIRRENVFLHKKLESCLQDVRALRDEVRDLKANDLLATKDELKDARMATDANTVAVQNLLAQGEKQRAHLDKQGHEVEGIGQSCASARSEISDLRNLTTKAQEDERVARIHLEKEFQQLRVDFRALMAAQQQQAQNFQVTLESFQAALDEKVDKSTTELLDRRLDSFRPHPRVHSPLPAVSQVSESIQVLDSQDQNADTEPYSLPRPPAPTHDHSKPHETVPDDLDLDANAHTISYVGHRQDSTQLHDSLELLPPSAVRATQLAKIKTLKQRRFDDWTLYYDQGQKILEILPRSFEETIVRNFVDGIFRDSHRKQCQQWLEANGWTWANVTAFGDICSQVIATTVASAKGDLQANSPPPVNQTNEVSLTETSVDNIQPRGGRKKRLEFNKREAPILEPLRRSQRLIGKNRGDSRMHQVAATKNRRSRPRGAETFNRSAHAKIGTDFAQVAEAQEQPNSRRGNRKDFGAHQHKEVKSHLTKYGGSIVSNGTMEDVDPLQPSGIRKHKIELSEMEQPAKRPKSNKPEAIDVVLVNPQPVLAKGHIDKPGTESSNDEGFLLPEALPKHRIFGLSGSVLRKKRPGKYSASRGVPQRQGHRGRRQLSLSPPPEIPILPTTDED